MVKQFIKDHSDTDNDAYLNIDKSWQGINYMLSGRKKYGKYPLGFMISSRNLFSSSIKYGTGQICYNAAPMVKAIYNAVSKITIDEFKDMYVKETLAKEEIYPTEIWEEPDTLDYLVKNFESLVEYYKTAADRGNAMIMYIG